MRLITSFELATRTKAELHIMFRAVAMIITDTQDPKERRDAVASLKNIARAIDNRPR